MNRETVAGVWSSLQIRLQKMPMETLFLVIFIVFGIIFTVIIPPGWNTDEPNHTYRIYQLLSGDLLSERTIDPQTGLKAYGGDVPTGLLKMYRATGSLEPGAVGDRSKKVDKQLYAHQPQLRRITDDGKRQPINFSGAALYSPVSYALYFPIFWLGKVTMLPFFWLIILGRLVGVAATGLAFFFAIRYAPIGKWLFFAVGLIPTVAVQSATVGADAPQLAVSVIFVVYVLRCLFANKKPRAWQYGLLAVLGATLVLIKLAYAPLLLLLLALPLIKKDYRGWKNLALLMAAIIIAIIPGLIWAKLVSYIDINSNPQANFAAQKMFIIDQPLTYISTLYHTFFTNQQTALANIFGSFIWDSVPLPAIYAYGAAAAVVVALFAKDKRESVRLPARSYNLLRLVLVVTIVATVLVVATALYIYSTTLHATSIVGIQSRYFIPLLPLVLLIFYGNTAKKQIPVKGAVGALSCLALIGAVLAIYLRLYQVIPLIA